MSSRHGYKKQHTNKEFVCQATDFIINISVMLILEAIAVKAAFKCE